MFTSTQNKGFQITFANGYAVSCQFGATNYCENYSRHFEPDYYYGEEKKKEIHSCANCEVAIWDKSGNWVTGSIIEKLGMSSYEEQVQGNVTPEEVAKIMAYVSSL